MMSPRVFHLPSASAATLIALCLVADVPNVPNTSESPGEPDTTPVGTPIGTPVGSGYAAQLTATTLHNVPGRRFSYKGQLFDLLTGEPVDRRPALLHSKHEALRWWSSVAPGAPTPNTLPE